MTILNLRKALMKANTLSIHLLSALSLALITPQASIAKTKGSGPLQEQIEASEKMYQKYVEEMNNQNKTPEPDYATDMLKRINQELLDAQENERLKKKFFENYYKKHPEKLSGQNKGQ